MATELAFDAQSIEEAGRAAALALAALPATATVFLPFAMASSSSSSSSTRYRSGGHRSSSSTSSGGRGASGRLASTVSRDYGGPDFDRANSHHSSSSPRNGSLHRHQVRCGTPLFPRDKYEYYIYFCYIQSISFCR